jgi:excinuclease ABC subunit A
VRIRDDVQQRLAESFETALQLTDGVALVRSMDDEEATPLVFSSRFACPTCGYSISELEPRMFSFNNPAGACESCDGLGVTNFFDPQLVVADQELTLAEGAIRGWDRRNVYYFHMLTSLAEHYGFDVEVPFKKLSKKHQQAILFGSGQTRIDFSYANDRGDIIRRRHRFEGVIPNMDRRYHETDSNMVRENLQKFLRVADCPKCLGTRLRQESRHVFVGDSNLPEITHGSVEATLNHFKKLKLKGQRATIADKILKEIRARLQFLVDVGLNYLTLDRSAETLSGGEAQRIRLASQIGAGLVGVMYILDEPSIGLHQRDNERLLRTLEHLRDLGNTVLVVEHDEEAIRAADFLIDIGPGAGVHGGEIVAAGSIDDIVGAKASITGQYLSGHKCIPVPAARTPMDDGKMVTLIGARGNNLQDVTIAIPCGLLTCVTGVSGSGKSTLINQTLYPIAATALNKATTLSSADHDHIEGMQNLDKVVDIDQSGSGVTGAWLQARTFQFQR